MGRLFFVTMLMGLMLQANAMAETKFVINGQAINPKDSAQAAQANASMNLMFDAARKVVKRDYKGAESIYNKVITLNKNNMDAYLQRGIVRRELGDEVGVIADGRAVVALANNALQHSPNDANLYHRRGMGLRLLKDFSGAKANIKKAIQMSNQLGWRTDLQAIELEEKVFK